MYWPANPPYDSQFGFIGSVSPGSRVKTIIIQSVNVQIHGARKSDDLTRQYERLIIIAQHLLYYHPLNQKQNSITVHDPDVSTYSILSVASPLRISRMSLTV